MLWKTGFVLQYREGNPEYFVRLDFLIRVQICIFFKTQICTEKGSRFSRHCTVPTVRCKDLVN